MAIFKCKMCGGTLEVNDATVAVCEYCGTRQTLPKLDDERKANLYDRANHFRRNNEFDKAMGIYEHILNDDSTDAESYWSLVLCRYGIEYVEDPATRKRIPTVNRAQFTSIYDDEDYKSAIRYADAMQKEIYESEAKLINNIQKGILSISGKEEPFDVFICYKETDVHGRRTRDSVLATELYHELEREGFKVFFSRITLEDKLGQEYEPYIFAALNSAPVMVVLGTSAEHLNSVWVKNEWSRYLSLIKNGARKVLIPAYRDMDPYDLPEEFSHLQAQDMSKLGFMQDLIRGIKKIVPEKTSQTEVQEVIMENTVNAHFLLKRAFLVLEDGEYEKANGLCEQVLNLEPENPMAYVCKLMLALRVKTQSELGECEQPFDNISYYHKALRFSDDELRKTLEGYIKNIKERNETLRITNLYNAAYERMLNAKTENEFILVADSFKTMPVFKDSEDLAEECLKRAEEIKVEKEKKAEISKKRRKVVFKFTLVSVLAISILLSLITVTKSIIIPSVKYSNANKLIESGEFQEAYNVLCSIPDFNDSWQKAKLMLEEHPYIARVGDVITYGTYEQDNNLDNGAEKIEWVVLEKDEDKMLVVSRYGMDSVNYNDKPKAVTWEESTIRTWANKTFLPSAFNKEEQKAILSVEIDNQDNLTYGVPGGNKTTDQIFLLSIGEVEKYFTTLEKRKCEVTEYAKANGAFAHYGMYGKWWLRSPGGSKITAAYCTLDGSIVNAGGLVSSYGESVRPAMWLDLNVFE